MVQTALILVVHVVVNESAITSRKTRLSAQVGLSQTERWNGGQVHGDGMSKKNIIV